MTDPIRPTDEDARQLARNLMSKARFAALGVIDQSGCPLVTRVAFGLCPKGRPISLVSTLSAHTRALQENPACSFMVGEPEDRGDPLTHPRLSLQGRARFIPIPEKTTRCSPRTTCRAIPRPSSTSGLPISHLCASRRSWGI